MRLTEFAPGDEVVVRYNHQIVPGVVETVGAVMYSVLLRGGELVWRYEHDVFVPE
jgi:hypothetical protein